MTDVRTKSETEKYTRYEKKQKHRRSGMKGCTIFTEVRFVGSPLSRPKHGLRNMSESARIYIPNILKEFANGNAVPIFIVHLDSFGAPEPDESHPTIWGGSLVAREKRPESVSDDLTHARCACIWFELVSSSMGERYVSKTSLFEQPLLFSTPI